MRLEKIDLFFIAYMYICYVSGACLVDRTVVLNFSGAEESIPRNRYRQPVKPGGLARQPYSFSVPGQGICGGDICVDLQHNLSSVVEVA
jgi:hypothetical protein